jgi:hypothetical protein
MATHQMSIRSVQCVYENEVDSLSYLFLAMCTAKRYALELQLLVRGLLFFGP